MLWSPRQLWKPYLPCFWSLSQENTSSKCWTLLKSSQVSLAKTCKHRLTRESPNPLAIQACQNASCWQPWQFSWPKTSCQRPATPRDKTRGFPLVGLNNLGPPVERFQEGYQLASVYFSREPSQAKKERRALGNLNEVQSLAFGRLGSEWSTDQIHEEVPLVASVHHWKPQGSRRQLIQNHTSVVQ